MTESEPEFVLDEYTIRTRLRIKRLCENAIVPTRPHQGDLGYDLYCSERTWVYPGEPTIVPTGIACGFPQGFGAFIKDRSGMAAKRSAHVVAGVIDNGYVGEIKVILANYGAEAFQIEEGEKFAQLVLIPIVIPSTLEVVDTLESADGRGTKGFGSTGE